MIFFSKVGYVNSLEGIFHLLSTIPVPWTSQYRGTTICFGPETQNAMGLDVLDVVLSTAGVALPQQTVGCCLPSVGIWLGLSYLVDLWLPGYTRKFLRHFYKVFFFVCFFSGGTAGVHWFGWFFFKRKGKTSPFLPPFFQGKFLIRCSFQRELGTLCHPYYSHTTPNLEFTWFVKWYGSRWHGEMCATIWDLFKVFYFLQWDSSAFFTTIWDNMFGTVSVRI